MLRRLAQRLDPQPDSTSGARCAGPVPHDPRPWTAVRRTARPARH
jgi:hypothetical protein